MTRAEPQLVWSGGHHARYLPSGHLVYLHQGTLFAAAFDLGDLTIRGQPIPIVEDVANNTKRGDGHFDISTEGTLAYVRAHLVEERQVFEWVDREGNTTSLTNLGPARYGEFKLSPNGKSLAYVVNDGKQDDIWIHDIERGVSEKLTKDTADDSRPIWSPTGQSIVFQSSRDGIHNLYWKRVNGSNEVQRLIQSPNIQFPWSWHPDGDYLAIMEILPKIGTSLRIVHLDGDDASGWTARKTEDALVTEFVEWSSGFSPDGRWLAYASNESGNYQIYFRAFPGSGGAKRISIEGRGSAWPTWSRTTNEMIFGTDEGVDDESQVYSVGYRNDGDSLVFDRPTRWKGGTFLSKVGFCGYDLHPDGKRILILKRAELDSEREKPKRLDHIVLFENFFDYLRKVVPVPKK